MTLMLVLTLIFFNRKGETITAKNVALLLYAAGFALGPVWLASLKTYHHIHYFGSDPMVEHLLESASLVVMVGVVFLILGYLLPMQLAAPIRTTAFAISDPQKSYAMTCALGLGAIGLVSYIGLVMQSGGLAGLLGYSGGRADMFQGIYGAWFWGVHFLFAAYGLLSIVLMRQHPWLCLLLALLLAMAFVPFQGRDIVVAPLFCWLLLYSGIRKPLPWRIVGGGALTIVLVSALLGAFRSGDVRNNVGSFFDTFSARAETHMTKVVSDNIEQLDAVMAAVKYIESGNKPIGPMALLSWAEPLDRALLGDVIPSIYSGIFIDRLLIPEHKGWNTAASPSLPGELFLGLGWSGIVIGMFAYGIVLALLMRWHDGRHHNPILYAAYPFVVFIMAKMLVDGTTHLFRALVVLFPVYACALMAPSGNPQTSRVSHDRPTLFSSHS